MMVLAREQLLKPLHHRHRLWEAIPQNIVQIGLVVEENELPDKQKADRRSDN